MKPLFKKFKRKAEKQAKKLRHILSSMVVIVMIARLLRNDYYAVFLCVLTLLLFNIPVFVDRKLRLKLPSTLEIIILLFVFSAEILGEVGSFYTYIPWWDSMLHTVNGFLMAAIGFALIDVLNNHPRFHISLSPVFVAFVAFCFSMTIGVAWEFFELGMDKFAKTDMQKDNIITSISSVKLNPEGINEPVKIENITMTRVFYTKNGTHLTYDINNGYLETGAEDTISDLMVNCIGAFIFSIIGYFYIIGRDRRKIAENFIPQMKAEAKKDSEV